MLYFRTLIISALGLIIVGGSVLLIKKEVALAADPVCQVISSEFSPSSDKTLFGPTGNLLQGTSGDPTTPVKFTLRTENCAKAIVDLKLYNLEGTEGEFFSKERIILTGNTAIFNFQANENPCYTSSSTADCLIVARIFNEAREQIHYSAQGVTFNQPNSNYFSGGSNQQDLIYNNASKGFLAYDCVEDCSGYLFFGNKSWEHTPSNDSGYQRTNIAGEVIGEAGITEFNTSSACYDATLNDGRGGYTPGCNELLAPLPGLTVINDTVTLGQYINIIVRIAIGLIVVFAVVMLIVYGFQYITQGSITGKADLKDKIRNATVGVLIALGIFVILSALNPNLLNLDPEVSGVSIALEGDANAPSSLPANLPPGQKVGIGAQNLDKSKITALGIHCPGTGGKSEIPKIIASINTNKDKLAYSQSLRGQVCEGTKVCTDCSHLTGTIILGCAGITSIKGTNTATMLTSANSPNIEKINTLAEQNGKVFVNGKEIQPGAILGWSLADKVGDTEPGHVVMYAGNGKIIEAANSNDDILYRGVQSYWKAQNRNWYRWIITLP